MVVMWQWLVEEVLDVVEGQLRQGERFDVQVQREGGRERGKG